MLRQGPDARRFDLSSAQALQEPARAPAKGQAAAAAHVGSYSTGVFLDSAKSEFIVRVYFSNVENAVAGVSRPAALWNKLLCMSRASAAMITPASCYIVRHNQTWMCRRTEWIMSELGSGIELWVTLAFGSANSFAGEGA